MPRGCCYRIGSARSDDGALWSSDDTCHAARSPQTQTRPTCRLNGRHPSVVHPLLPDVVVKHAV